MLEMEVVEFTPFDVKHTLKSHHDSPHNRSLNGTPFSLPISLATPKDFRAHIDLSVLSLHGFNDR